MNVKYSARTGDNILWPGKQLGRCKKCLMSSCGATYSIDEIRVECGKCGNMLDVAYAWDRLPVPKSLSYFEEKWSRRAEPHCFSGVWRFHDLLPFVPLLQCV